VSGGRGAQEPSRALSDIRQRFPQWHITQALDGWQATPRAIWSGAAPTLESLYEHLKREEDRREGSSRDEPRREEVSLPKVVPRPRSPP
jgi:hypothetical protein